MKNLSVIRNAEDEFNSSSDNLFPVWQKGEKRKSNEIQSEIKNKIIKLSDNYKQFETV